MSVLDLLEDIIIKTGYQEELVKNNEQERLENIEELKQGILEFQNTDIEEKTLQEYLDKISLFTDNDRTNKESAVKLMTIHNSKGLEFKNVFVCRINEGILPSGKVITPEAIEEERRLCYVAITRAKDRLFLSDVQNITGDYECNVSRFLLELDKEQLEFVDEQSKDRLSEIKVNNKDMAILGNMEFKVGDNVEHFIFGKGIIEQVDEENRTYSIKFEKFETLRTISANIKLDKIPTNTKKYDIIDVQLLLIQAVSHLLFLFKIYFKILKYKQLNHPKPLTKPSKNVAGGGQNTSKTDISTYFSTIIYTFNIT